MKKTYNYVKVSRMMKYLLIVGVLMTSWTVQAQDRSIRFEEGSYQEVLAKAKKENKLLFIDCYTSWCGPCKMVAPIISQIAEEYNGKVKVCKVNVDDQGELAAQNAIVSIPTVILFIDGKPVKKIIGAHSLDDYEDAIDEFI